MKTYKVLCNCKHEFQDQVYGPKVRIATPTQRTPSASDRVVRCTVCAKEQTVKN